MNFVSDIQPDQQRRHRFNDARILKLAAIDGTNSWNLRREFAGNLLGFFVVAANEYIAFDCRLAFEQGSAEIVKRRGEAYFFRK